MPNNQAPGFYNPRLVLAFVLTISSVVCLVVGAESEKSRATKPVATVASTPGTPPSAATNSTATDSTAPRFDCCALLTAEEIEAVQGSPIKDKNNSERSAGGLRTTQCFYNAVEYSRSVILGITQSDPSDPSKRSAAGYWSETFGRYARAAENEDTQKEPRGARAEEKEGMPPKKVEGVGDEAYWSANRVGGALYVRKNDVILRISLGGKGREETRLEKSKALAQKALARL